jgi:hypothetical protein
MSQKKSPPVAVCTDCRHYSYNITRVNERCGQNIGGKRCKGVYASTVNVGDWGECTTCQATGRVEGAPCDYCGGYGWLLKRNPL